MVRTEDDVHGDQQRIQLSEYEGAHKRGDGVWAVALSVRQGDLR